MVGNGNRPLDHYDEDTLEEYVLGQLLPAEEDATQQHLADCSMCRAAEAEIRAFCHQLSLGLRRELDNTKPDLQLDFDRISVEWRKPPQRVSLGYRLRQLAPNVSSLLLIGLLMAAFALLFSSNSTAALNSLELTEHYYGPPAIVAATTQHGLVIVELTSDQPRVTRHLPLARSPRNLTFSSNGQWLAFQQGAILHVLETRNGGAEIRLKAHQGADWAWSPDSRALAYTDGSGQLILFDVITQSDQVLAPANEGAWGRPVWTADGQQLAYAVTGNTLAQGIWRATPATGFRVELARNHAPENARLLPAAWTADRTALLAWDYSAVAQGRQPALYRVDVVKRSLERIEGLGMAQDLRLAWPVSAQDTVILMRQNDLIFWNLKSQVAQVVPEQIPWPHTLDWAPNGAWLAYTVASATEGNGVFLYAPEEGKLHPAPLPRGAAEKDVIWAGAEHLFVVRQPRGEPLSELWLVPLTTGEPPLRVMTNLRSPLSGPNANTSWHDILATQIIP